MDGWNAPQWADFDASVKSDIDEYFNFEHKELESGLTGDLEYHSCPSTPNSKKAVGESPYKTPQSSSKRTSHGLTSYMNNLQISEEKKMLIGKMSMTPRSYVLRNACSRPRGSSTPHVVKDESATSDKIANGSKESSNNTNESVKGVQDTTAAAEVVENLEATDSNDEDDNTEQNCTLLAAAENADVSPNRNETDKIRSVTIEKTADAVATADVKEEPKITEARDETEIPNASSSEQGFDKIDKKTSNPEICATATKRTNPNVRKNSSRRPTVLTSHARRQSTSKYRRASNKYVSLAEAVSKFQNGTPERFRSIHKKDPKTLGTAGSLQKVKHAALKLTHATSPLLRCKYRSRIVSMPSQEEREVSKMEEIRKNRLKSNPIKQSVSNPQRQLKNTASLPKATSKVSKTSVGVPLEKKDSKLTDRQKVTRDPSKLVKKVGESTAVNCDTASRCKTMMPPPKPRSREIKKSVSCVDSISLSRRTIMNPPKALERLNKPAMSSGTLSLSRRTIANPSKSLLKIDNKPITIVDSSSGMSDKLINPPEPLKSINVRPKSAVESVSLMDKTKDASVLSTSILPDSVRKHTPCKKTVPTVVSTEEGVSIKDVEILHFGIPVGNNYKKITETVPFSFESHNKKLQSKKEKLKSQQIEEEKKTKPFQARPVPSYITKSSSNVAKLSNKPVTTTDAPFSFQRRNEMTLKKKKELFDQVVEREKQARIFHAKPAPKFKPVFVRGASSENLRSNNLIAKDKKISQETKQRGLSQGSIIDNRENTAPNVPTTNQPKLKDPLMNLKLKKSVVK